MVLKKFIYRIFTIILIGQPLYIIAQTPVDKIRISQTYNQEYLGQLQTKLYNKSIQEKRYALEQAKIFGWQITIKKPDGRFSELMKVVDGKPIYYTTSNADAAVSTRTNFLHNAGGLGLNLEGQNMEAHVWDGGLARSTHQEYDGVGGNNRFSIGDGTSTLHYHSAHVTGTIIASGVEPQAKGMAPQANAIGYEWNNDLSEATNAAANGMLLSNHSYGYDTSSFFFPDWYFGAYNDESRDWDVLMYNTPYYLMVNAAGNDGSNDGYNSVPLDGNSAYDKLAGHSTSKNALVVANAQDADIYASGSLGSVAINSSSSEGPTDDYRIKPDITGNGTGLYSTYEDAVDSYASISGTSMASPNVTGSLLLLQQHYNNLNASFMRAATLKGLALHTADDAGTSGPDAIFGWGLLNAKEAANTITKNTNETLIDERTLIDGQSYQITVDADGINDLVASISWTDPAGTANTGIANDTTPVLVNDLDIRVTKNANTYYPFLLTTITTNDTGDNIVDPYERVDVVGAEGTYTVTVSHKGSLLGGAQDFTLIITGRQYIGVCNATTPINFSLLDVGATDASLVWDEVQGANYEIRYRETGTTSWNTLTSTEELVTLTSLNILTEYEVQVRSFCQDTSTSAYSNSLLFTTTDCSVCTASGSTQYPDGTTLVSFNTINNASSGVSDYSDYTIISTEVIKGDSYDLIIHVNTDGDYKEVSKVWIDWNGDCIFNTTDEEYDLGEAINVSNGATSNSPLSILVPTDAVIGSKIMRVSSAYTGNPTVYPTSCQTGFLGEVEDYTLIISNCESTNQTTWNGSTWSNGTPDATKPAVIAGNYNDTTNFTCCELTINTGATLTINAGEYIQIENDVVNNGTLIIDHEGSLVQTDDTSSVSGSGTFQVQKTTPTYIEYDFTYWSSPIETADLGTVFSASQQSRIFDFTTANFDDANDDTFDDNNDDWAIATGTMTKGKGYIVEGEGSDWPFDAANIATDLTQSVSFNGTINNGPIEIEVFEDANQTDAFENQNLIGNPYPSAIDIKKLYSENQALLGLNSPLEGTFYFWTHGTQIGTQTGNPGPDAYNFTNDDYAVATTNGTNFNSTASTGTVGKNAPEFIASGQGFFVDTKDDGDATVSESLGNIVFNNSMRVTGSNNTFLRVNPVVYDRIWLNMTKDDVGLFRQVLIGFFENATDDHDSGIDGKRLENGNNFDFYSVLNNKRYAIQGLESFYDTKTINLGFEIIEAGTYEINIDHFEGIFTEGQAIYLEDTYSNIIHNFANGAYTFTSEIGDAIVDRFILRFTNDVLGLNDDILNTITVYPNPSTAIFNISIQSNKTLNIEVYDLTGKIVKQHFTGNQIDLTGYAKGIYFARLSVNGAQTVKKLVLK